MSGKSILRSLNARLMPGNLLYKPFWLVMGVNNVCNLHCKMCDVGTGTKNTNFAVNLTGTDPMNMPPELFRKIVDDAAEWCPRVKIGYGSTEPLVYPYLEETLRYATSKNLHTAITTNALNLPRHAKMLCDAGLKEIFISLDGPEDVHNQIRGNKSSFQKAVEGIRLLMCEKNRPEISVFCVITEWNVHRLAEFAEYFSGFDLVRLGFMHTNFTMQDAAERHNAEWGAIYAATPSNVAETHIQDIDLTILEREIKKIKEMRLPFDVSFSPELNSKEELETYYLRPEVILGKRCSDVFHNIMIKSDGSVIPAHGRCYNLTIGNVSKESLKDVWNSKVIARFRKDLLSAGGFMPACSRCCSAF